MITLLFLKKSSTIFKKEVKCNGRSFHFRMQDTPRTLPFSRDTDLVGQFRKAKFISVESTTYTTTKWKCKFCGQICNKCHNTLPSVCFRFKTFPKKYVTS